MGCLSGIAKYILFLFNFLIVACGVILIVIGAIILVNENKGIDSLTEFSVGGFAIAVGVIIFMIAFFGCCGAIKENSCMLTTYAIILIVLLILQVVLGALAFVAVRNDDNKLNKDAAEVVKKVFDKYFDNDDTETIVNDIQQGWECCGVEGPSYWMENHFSPPPQSCFDDPNILTSIYQKGCADAFVDIITSNIQIIGGIAIGFAVVELVGAIFAFIVRSR